MLYPRKILLSELNTLYPGMVDAVMQHEGIGMILGYEDDGSILAIGKQGTRNLNTGEVIGDDPLVPYAPDSGHGAGVHRKTYLAIEACDGISQRRRSLAHQHRL